METKAIQKIITLVAKTGLFFANADGKYDVKERSFIDGFLNKLSQIGSVDEIKDELADCLNKTYTLESIVADTKDLLDDFNPTEQAAIKQTLALFVDQVIDADSMERPIEKQNFDAWKKAIG